LGIGPSPTGRIDMTTRTSAARKPAAPKPEAKTAPKAPEAEVKVAESVRGSKEQYRVLVRLLAVKAGWKVTSKDGTDTFTKDGVTIAVHHTNHIAVAAEKVAGDAHEKAPAKGKWFTVQAWINGSDQPFKSQLSLLDGVKPGVGLAKV
jgi:hypothetical protein